VFIIPSRGLSGLGLDISPKRIPNIFISKTKKLRDISGGEIYISTV